MTIRPRTHPPFYGKLQVLALTCVAAGAVTALAAGCGDRAEKWTGVRLVVQFAPALEIDQLQFAVSLDGTELLSGVRRPALPDGLLDGDGESVILRFDHEDAGGQAQVWVEGLSNGVVVAIGQGEVTLERKVLVPLAVTLTSTAGCGDGEVVAPEQCDDGNDSAGDGCSESCREESGWSCEGEPSQCETVCGDGLVIAPAEECDDENTTSQDGCAADCTVESGWSCEGEPSQCEILCGDGLVRGDEQCDDGNVTDGDGCGADCAVEPGWRCESEPSECAEAADCVNDADCAADSLCDRLTGTCEFPEDVLWVDCNAGGCPGQGTQAAPYCDLGGALAAVQAGQAIRIEGGACAGPYTIATDGITVYGSDTAVLTAASCPALTLDGVTAVVRNLTVGGGVDAGGVAALAGAGLILEDTTVSDATCIGVDCQGSLCELRRNTVLRNEGGGVRVQGSHFRLVNNVVAENGANTSDFGGVSLDAAGAAPAVFLHNTVVGNDATNGPNGHAGVYCATATELRNSILWGQVSDDAVEGSCTPYYCIVDQAGFDGLNHNSEADPLLDGSYRLTSASTAAIDQGDSSGVTPPELDIDRETRPQGCCVDIGADEYVPPSRR